MAFPSQCFPLGRPRPPLYPCRSTRTAKWQFIVNVRAQMLTYGAGFTLLELMIVITVLGILTGIALPSYQNARNAALIGKAVDALIDHSNVCAVINAAGIGEKPTPPPLSLERGGVVILSNGCDGVKQGATLEATWGQARARGVACLQSRSISSSSKARIVVSPEGALTCTFED